MFRRPTLSSSSKTHYPVPLQARLLSLSQQLEKKIQCFVVLEALFAESGLTAKTVSDKSDYLTTFLKDNSVAIKPLFWGLELFAFRHQDDLKKFPLVCKALYDLDVLEKENFLPYWEGGGNHANPGHEMVRKQIASFAEWLAADSSSDESD